MRGTLLKMTAVQGEVVQYSLNIGGASADLNPSLGKKIRLVWTGQIHCVACGAKTSKSYDQGHCWPCFQSLAACDMCIMKPELCHFERGTCREPEWGQAHCMIPHVVYLANSSGLKVGITRAHTRLTRWMDQGAASAIVLGVVERRRDSGLAEAYFRDTLGVKDRTDWRAMLRGEPEVLDLQHLRAGLGAQWPASVPAQPALDEAFARVETFKYPVLEYPVKVSSLNVDKDPNIIAGTLLGIKGQYLILDKGVVNLRKYQGYEFVLEEIAG